MMKDGAIYRTLMSYYLRGIQKTFYNRDLKDMISTINKKFNLYVQIGSQIKKDNNWFKKKGLM